MISKTASLLIKCGYISSTKTKSPTNKSVVWLYRQWNKFLCSVSAKHEAEVQSLLYSVYKPTIHRKVVCNTKYHGKGKLPRKKNVRL